MSLIACPECQRSISDRARTCPGCGYPLAEPWTARLRRAWREGFHHAWIAAVGCGFLMFATLVAAGLVQSATTVSELLLVASPWLVIVGVYGFIAGLAAIGVAALVRSRWRREYGTERWVWSRPAAVTVVTVFAALMVFAIRTGA